MIVLAEEGAPRIREGLAGAWWSLPFQRSTGLCAVLVITSPWGRRFGIARLYAMAQVTLIVWGWLLAQYPFAVLPDLTFEAAAATDAVLRPVLGALAIGSLILIPSFVYLFKVFKGRQS